MHQLIVNLKSTVRFFGQYSFYNRIIETIERHKT